MVDGPTYGQLLLATFDNYFESTTPLSSTDLLRLANEVERWPDSKQADLWAVLAPLHGQRSARDTGLADSFSAQAHWLALRRATGHRPDAVTSQISLFKQLLLYYPRVVITPTHLVDYRTYADWVEYSPPSRSGGKSLPAEVMVGSAALLDLRELIDAGTLVVVPPLADRDLIVSSTNAAAPALTEDLLRDDAITESVLIRAFDSVRDGIPVIDKFSPFPWHDLAHDVVRGLLEEVWSAEATGANYVADTTELWTVLVTALRADRARASHPDVQFALLAPQVLPALDALDLADIVAIRRSDDYFAAWHASLRKIIRNFLRADVSGVDLRDEFREIAEEELLPTLLLLKTHIETDSLWRRIARRGGLTFSLGASALSASSGGVVPMGAGALGGLGTLTSYLLTESAPSLGPSQRALIKHCSVLART